MINVNNKLNVMTLSYTVISKLKIYLIIIGTQKINNSFFQIYSIVILNLKFLDKLNKAGYFQKPF